jgi:hypothetical protein
LCENIFHTGSAKRFFNGVKMSININIEKLKKDITSEDILASLFYYAVFGEKIEYNVDTELKVEVNDNNITTQVTTFKPTENTTKPKAKTLKTPKNQPDETSKYFGILPQTGQLKWIIPALLIVGFVCIGIGIQLLKKENKSE